jgi:carotenoid cleavage dioxygenase-like enzyme
MATATTPKDLAPLLERVFLFDAFEGSYEITGIEGRLPEWLRGSYFVNGPARFERAGRRCQHWLDGDGMVGSVRITDRGVFAKIDSSFTNFGVSFSATQPLLHVYEFDLDGALRKRRRFPLDMQHSIHDFGVTPNRGVFFLSPLLMNFHRFWGEGISVMESLSWEPDRGSTILVTPRAHSEQPAFSVPAGRGYCLHFINCFERGDQVIVDVIELDEPVYREYQPIPDLFATVSEGRPVRFVIDAAAKKLVERIELDYQRSPDFPSIDASLVGLPYDEFWMLGISDCGQPGRKFFNELAHGSWKDRSVRDVYRAPAGEYLGGEPVHVGHGEEGVVLVQHLMPASGSADYLVFDSSSVRSGPIARLPLRHPVHPGFHASFRKAEAAP